MARMMKPDNHPSKPKREVQVIACPSAFPISSRKSTIGSKSGSSSSSSIIIKNSLPPKSSSNDRRRVQRQSSSTRSKNNAATASASTTASAAGNLLDWHETVKDVQAYGATAFVGKDKRDYEDEEYFRLTGRHKKKQKVPLPIVRGIRKAAAKREAKAREEARKSGVVIPKAKNETKSKKFDSTSRIHGPAPSIGFMKQGVYRVSKNKDNKNNVNKKRKRI